NCIEPVCSSLLHVEVVVNAATVAVSRNAEVDVMFPLAQNNARQIIDSDRTGALLDKYMIWCIVLTEFHPILIRWAIVDHLRAHIFSNVVAIDQDLQVVDVLQWVARSRFVIRCIDVIYARGAHRTRTGQRKQLWAVIGWVWRNA